MRRTITTLSLAAAAALALTSCASAAADPTAPPAAPTPATDTPSASAAPSSSAPAHSHSASPKSAESAAPHADHDDDDAPGQHDDTYKDVALKKASTYTITSSTDQTKFLLTIVSFDCKTPYPDAGRTAAGKAAAFVADPGKTLCVAKVSAKNVGPAPDHLALNYVAIVVDSAGKWYDETTSPNFTTQSLMTGLPSMADSVDPGKTGWMVLGYEVPTSAKGPVLRLDTSPPSH